MSKRPLVLPALIFASMLGVASETAAAQAKAGHLDEVLHQMNRASEKFQNATADVHRVIYTKIVDDTGPAQAGIVYFLRKDGGTEIGMKFNPPGAQTVEYRAGKLRLYSADTNKLQEFSATGKDQAKFDTYLALATLGFGGSGDELTKAWTVTDQGTETLKGESASTEKLDLVAKDADMRKNYSHITIWVDPVRGVSLKQVFFTPGGDTQTATYSNIKINQKVDLAAFAIKCKGKCD